MFTILNIIILEYIRVSLAFVFGLFVGLGFFFSEVKTIIFRSHHSLCLNTIHVLTKKTHLYGVSFENNTT